MCAVALEPDEHEQVLRVAGSVSTLLHLPPAVPIARGSIHISLSRTFYLQFHEIAALHKRLQSALRDIRPYATQMSPCP